MNFLKPLAVVLVFCAFINGKAQPLPTPLNITQTYKKQTRDNSGLPGKNYWQNTANYNIQVNFNPETLLLQGFEEIDYINNSPDTLNEIVFKLYPNLYKKGAQRQMKIESAQDITDGVTIESITINGLVQKLPLAGVETDLSINPISILPKTTTHFTVKYSYTLNKTSHIRTGEIEPGADFVAYFYPRIAVYDDIDGWNKNPYLGTQEFYNDFCNFKVNITLPAGYIAWATGTLLNAKDVLADKYYQRLSTAEKQDAITTIIDSTDVAQKNATTNIHTWQFEATNVTDFAFANSNHYMWQSSSLVVDKKTGRRTRVDAVFNPKHKDYLNVCKHARQTVEAMSYTFPKWPYPYPHETVFDGLDQMEYPMMVNDNPEEDVVDEITLTDHEIFHTMFPFYMGINETKYGWMDEGWATMGEWLISPLIDTTIVDEYGMARYEKAAGKEEDLPVTTLSTQLSEISFYINSYPKPGLGYLYIKDLLGDELFTKALHHYIETWHGKHPMPNDFFNCMNEGCGQNLNWFWKRWFFDSGFPDLEITSVKQKKNNYTVTIVSIGTKPVPVDLTIYFADGTTQKLQKNISCWQNGNALTTLTFTNTKKVTKVVLGSTYMPDVNKADNVFIL